MKQLFKGLKLYNDSGIIVEPNIEVSKDRIIAVVKYDDYGDDLLAVKTEDGCYIYGWLVDRPGHSDYYDVIEHPNWYVGEGKEFYRAPKLYYKLEDYNSHHRVGEIDGVAGIVDISKWERHKIEGDHVDFIWYRGRMISKKAAKVRHRKRWEEEWGEFDRESFDLDRFV